MVMGRWIECRGDLLAEGAKSLQLRLRDRFRVVTVNYHRRRNLRIAGGGGGYFSSTVQRWLDRFSDFRRDSLPSSSTFYRKRVSKDIDAEDDSVLTRMLQAVAVPVIGNVCHVFMHGLNRIQIFGAEKLQHAVLNRPENKSLITVSNHVAAMDDPLVIASLLPPGMLLDANGLRWTLCASDRCFKNPVTSAFFKYAKVLPVSRGDGIYQKGMDLAISKLNRGGWVHIFPEGSRSRDGGKTMGSAKRGIGRLVLDADNIPMVVPFVHTGMQDVMPVGAKFPRIGKTVTILVGDPISFDDLINEGANKNISRGKLYDAVSARIGDRLQKLKLQVEGLAIEQALQLQTYPSHVTERAAGLLQNVDWESLGMENYIGIDDNSPRQEPLLGPNVAQLYPQESSHDERCSRVGASAQNLTLNLKLLPVLYSLFPRFSDILLHPQNTDHSARIYPPLREDFCSHTLLISKKMVGDCMDCRKWEENMYWSRFQTVQFCQVLTGRFDEQLAIPKKFANNLREKMAGTVALKGPSGHEWSVGLVTNGDMLLLGHGWKAFVEDHSLEENDILIFKYNGNSRFEVLMFDQASLCEKTTSYFVKKCEHTESARGNKRGRSLEESFDETNQSPDDVADDHRAKKPRSDAAQTPPSRIQPSRSTSRSRRGIKRGKRGSRAAHPLQLKSRRREVTEEEKQRAQQMAVAETSENSFIVVMRASHVYRGFFMSVPAEWARRHLPNKSHDIELHANGNVWIAKYHYKGYGGGLTGGWKNFVMENFLEESDVCLFDLISGTDDAIILDVKIFRVVEEVIPPSQVMRETSRGTSKRASKFVMDSVSEEDV